MEIIFFTQYLQEWHRVKLNNQVYQGSLHSQKLQTRLRFLNIDHDSNVWNISGLSDKKEVQNVQKLTVHLD